MNWSLIHPLSISHCSLVWSAFITIHCNKNHHRNHSYLYFKCCRTEVWSVCENSSQSFPVSLPLVCAPLKRIVSRFIFSRACWEVDSRLFLLRCKYFCEKGRRAHYSAPSLWKSLWHCNQNTPDVFTFPSPIHLCYQAVMETRSRGRFVWFVKARSGFCSLWWIGVIELLSLWRLASSSGFYPVQKTQSGRCSWKQSFWSVNVKRQVH